MKKWGVFFLSFLSFFFFFLLAGGGILRGLAD